MIIEKNKCCIVIPVYKNIPSPSEIASLKQVLRILSDYKICFICAQDFNPVYYTNVAIENKNDSFFIETFKNSYFSSVEGYNKLLLSIEFYKRLCKFEYMLIYQLDAWVFKDELKHWCSQNLDYIGAPWFHKNKEGYLIFDGTGNGGFSLRRIYSHISVLKSFSLIKKPGYFWYFIKKHKSLASLFKLFKGITFSNNTHYLFNDFDENEDKFWGLVTKRNFKWFKVADLDLAKKFSVEQFPSDLIISDSTLPFGCHAWEKHEPSFWNQYIKI